MQVFETGRFKKAYKKLNVNQRQDLNLALKEIIKDPLIGEQKKGNLAWLRVYKCKVVNQLTLIGYSIDQGHLILTFVAIGSHENFYRDLEN